MATDPSTHNSVALIVGVTGMVGFSLAQALKEPAAPASPWTVYGSSRRPPPASFPDETLDRFVQLDALDRESTVAALTPLAPYVTHLFWVALAAHDTEEENIAANSAMLANVLHALTASGESRLRHVALQTGTKHYFGPKLDGIGSVEVPFREDAPRFWLFSVAFLVFFLIN